MLSTTTTSGCTPSNGRTRTTTDPRSSPSLDSGKDFLELTKVKLEGDETGLLMIGGGVPKNFAQDIVVAAEVLGKNVSMHKYAVQITVADERVYFVECRHPLVKASGSRRVGMAELWQDQHL